MAEAKRDNNYITTLLAVSNVDGVTPVVLYADPVTHRLLVSSSGGGVAGSDTEVQFNDGGAFGADAGMTYNKTTDVLTLAGGVVIGSSNPFSDAAGTLTLQNVDALDATTEATIEAAIDTLANLTSIQGQTFTLTGAFIRSGAHSLTLTTSGATNVTLPTTGTLVTLAGAESLTNKTISGSTNILGAVTMTLGSDADGDIYYRSSNVLTRLPKGTAAQVLKMNAGATAPEWATASSGGAWTLVSYSTATDAASITVSSLDLATDLYYDIVCQITQQSGARDENYITVNGSATGYVYLNNYVTFNGNATAASGNLFSATNTQFSIGDGVNAVSNATYHVRVYFLDHSATARPFFEWTRTGAVGSDAEMLSKVTGTGYNNGITNLTSIKFEPGSAVTADYKVWVRKANTA